MERSTFPSGICHKFSSPLVFWVYFFAQKGARETFQDSAAPFITGLEGLPGAKCFTDCEMHYNNSNPADARVKPTWKVCKNSTVFGSYDEMIPLLIVRIINHPKETLDYNSILSTTAMHFGSTTSWGGNANILWSQANSSSGWITC